MSAYTTSNYADHVRNPETWLTSARRNMAVANLLFKRHDELFPGSGDRFDEYSGCFYASFLHAGFAVENAVKAALVHRDPSVIRNDGRPNWRKFGAKSGHELRELVRALFQNISQEDERLLLKLEEHVIWVGRYTVPRDGTKLQDKEVMSALRLSLADDRDRIQQLFERLVSAARESAAVTPQQ